MQYVPQINKTCAIAKLTAKDNPFQRKKILCSSELIYLPYYLFAVKIYLDNGKVESSYVCVDLISGECAYLTNRSELTSTGNTVEFSSNVSEEEAREIVQRFVINEILYKKKKYLKYSKLSFELETIFEYPYWIGYFKRRNGADFDVIDGVTGQKQGPKMKTVFIKYLMQ